MNRFFSLVLPFILSACTTPGPVATSNSSFVFPDGNYHQDVVVEVKAKGHENNFDFSCLVQKKPNSFLLLGFNSFGISLFKIKEADQKIEMESSVRQIYEKKEFFLKVFNLVKSLMIIEKNDPRLKKGHFEIQFQDIKSTVAFGNYDSLQIPLQIKIETPNLYQIDIQTTKYDFN